MIAPGSAREESRKSDPVRLTTRDTKWLLHLLETGGEHSFYTWAKWQRERAYVLAQDHYDCQVCKARGRRRQATIVHHVKHLRDRPDLALSMWDGKERQLVSVCKACHEDAHPESFRQTEPAHGFQTEERWD